MKTTEKIEGVAKLYKAAQKGKHIDALCDKIDSPEKAEEMLRFVRLVADPLDRDMLKVDDALRLMLENEIRKEASV